MNISNQYLNVGVVDLITKNNFMSNLKIIP